MTTAAIYARASVDRDDRRVSVDRQVERCRKLADDLGAEHVEVYVDNDRSGTDAERPGYLRLLDDIRLGEIDTIVVHEQSRLTRDPGQWETFMVTAYRAGIDTVHTVNGGAVRIAEGDRLLSRIMSAVDAEERDRIRVRMAATHDQLAKEGRFTGGVPYGYERVIGADDRPTIVPVEPDASVVREMADAILDGQSLTGVTRSLNDRGVPTARGGRKWWPTAVRAILTNPTIAGYRVHHGEIAGPGQWEGIITPQMHERLCAVLGTDRVVVGSDGQEHRVVRRRRTRAYRLLSGGMIRCGRCGQAMRSTASPRRKGPNVRAYGCRAEGCRVTISPADTVDELVTEAVLHRLSTGSLVEQLADVDGARSDLLAELLDAEETMTAAAEMLGAGEIELSAFRAINDAARSRAEKARGELAAQAYAAETLPPLAGIEERWEELTRQQRQAVLDLVLEAVVVAPAKRGSKAWDANRIDLRWKS